MIQLLQRFQEWQLQRWSRAERWTAPRENGRGNSPREKKKKLVANQAFAWKLVDLGIEREVKLIACEAEGGRTKVREATDSLAVSWDAVWRSILFPVALIMLQPHKLPLNFFHFLPWRIPACKSQTRGFKFQDAAILLQKNVVVVFFIFI